MKDRKWNHIKCLKPEKAEKQENAHKRNKTMTTYRKQFQIWQTLIQTDQ